jgi:hypothetical protein
MLNEPSEKYFNTKEIKTMAQPKTQKNNGLRDQKKNTSRVQEEIHQKTQ